MKLMKQTLRKTTLYRLVKKWHRKLRNVPRHPLQDMPATEGLNLVHLGTEYGGWTFVDNGDLYGCTIISAGLGEDASFDVEFAGRYNAKIIVVDPTPRAVRHFNEIVEKLGSNRSCQYSRDGKQSVQAYDLSSLSPSNLVLVDKALWNESTVLKFFEPANPQHVSHSIVNFQQGYRDDSSYIEVRTVTLSELLVELGLQANEIELIKLDIEGAEIEVLTHCITQGIKPKQILVEFDELNVPSKKGFDRVSQMHEFLSQNGYRMIKTDGQADFLYLMIQ